MVWSYMLTMNIMSIGQTFIWRKIADLFCFDTMIYKHAIQFEGVSRDKLQQNAIRTNQQNMYSIIPRPQWKNWHIYRVLTHASGTMSEILAKQAVSHVDETPLAANANTR